MAAKEIFRQAEPFAGRAVTFPLRSPDLAAKSATRSNDVPAASVAFVSDAALVQALRAGQAPAIRAFYERFSRRVLAILRRILGHDPELADAHQEAFERALASIRGLRDPTWLDAWVTKVAVFTARSVIQRRVRRRWLRFMAPEQLPEVAAASATGEVEEALRATYGVLAQLATDDRIAFALRFIEGMQLQEGAAACGVSLATFKRRLARAERRFIELARENPVLCEWLEGGSRWGTRTAP